MFVFRFASDIQDEDVTTMWSHTNGSGSTTMINQHEQYLQMLTDKKPHAILLLAEPQVENLQICIKFILYISAFVLN